MKLLVGRSLPAARFVGLVDILVLMELTEAVALQKTNIIASCLLIPDQTYLDAHTGKN